MAVLTKLQERKNMNLNAWSYKEKGTFEVCYCSGGSCTDITTDSRYSIWVHRPGPGSDGLKKMETILELERLFYNSGESPTPWGLYDELYRAKRL